MPRRLSAFICLLVAASGQRVPNSIFVVPEEPQVAPATPETITGRQTAFIRAIMRWSIDRTCGGLRARNIQSRCWFATSPTSIRCFMFRTHRWATQQRIRAHAPSVSASLQSFREGAWGAPTGPRQDFDARPRARGSDNRDDNDRADPFHRRTIRCPPIAGAVTPG